MKICYTVKYRTLVLLDTDSGLFEGLQVTVGGEPFTTSHQSNWASLAVASITGSSVPGGISAVASEGNSVTNCELNGVNLVYENYPAEDAHAIGAIVGWTTDGRVITIAGNRFTGSIATDATLHNDKDRGPEYGRHPAEQPVTVG